MSLASVMDGVNEKCGLARNPASMYPSMTGCLSHLNSNVVTPARTSIRARSDIMGANVVGICCRQNSDVKWNFIFGKSVCAICST